MSGSSLSDSTPTGTHALILALANVGLIQFGRYVQPDHTVWPVAVNLRWLPSYPDLLRTVAGALEPLLLSTDADRVLTTADAIPLGVALSLRTGRPMVYPYGDVRDYTAAYVIEGAYDVGHPTVLLSDVLIDAAQAKAITALARRVGLDIHSVLAVIDLGLGADRALRASGYAVSSVLALRDALPVLHAHDLLTSSMQTAAEVWLDGYGEND
ncbi:MAG: hypothetical protein JW966_06765 [Anaerolineae bacterium]|nr:hypothetical protein [Anaerolineae bacterium]